MKFKRDIFDSILIYLCILLSGTDIWSIAISDINVRIVQIFYVLVLIYFFIIYGAKIINNKTIYLFLFIMIICTIFAIDKLQSLKYLGFGIYNIFIVVPIFYLYFMNHSYKYLIKILSYVVYTLFILVTIQMFVEMVFNTQIPFFNSQHYKSFIRPSLWFYEPSYLATYLSFFLGIFSFLSISLKKNRYFIELGLVTIIILTTTSTTGFLAIILSFILSLILRLIRIRNIKQIIRDLVFFSTLAIIAILLFKFIFPSVFESFFMRIFDQGIERASGERISDYHYALDIFKNYPILGVGLDCYGVYLGDKNLVPTNLTLELLSTMGLVGCISFYLIPIGLIYQNRITKRYGYNEKYYESSSLIFSLIIFILVLQANQNFMRLYLWIFISLSSTFVLKFKTEKFENEYSLNKII